MSLVNQLYGILEHIFPYKQGKRITSAKRVMSTSLKIKITPNENISVKKHGLQQESQRKKQQNMPTPLHVVTHKMPTISHLWVYVYSLHCNKKSAKQVLSPFSKSLSNMLNPKTGKARI